MHSDYHYTYAIWHVIVMAHLKLLPLPKRLNCGSLAIVLDRRAKVFQEIRSKENKRTWQVKHSKQSCSSPWLLVVHRLTVSKDHMGGARQEPAKIDLLRAMIAWRRPEIAAELHARHSWRTEEACLPSRMQHRETAYDLKLWRLFSRDIANGEVATRYCGENGDVEERVPLSSFAAAGILAKSICQHRLPSVVLYVPSILYSTQSVDADDTVMPET